MLKVSLNTNDFIDENDIIAIIEYKGRYMVNKCKNNDNVFDLSRGKSRKSIIYTGNGDIFISNVIPTTLLKRINELRNSQNSIKDSKSKKKSE